jgi:hypothetical protein
MVIERFIRLGLARELAISDGFIGADTDAEG